MTAGNRLSGFMISGILQRRLCSHMVFHQWSWLACWATRSRSC